MFVLFSIYFFIHLKIYFYIYPFIHPSIHPFLSTHSPIYQFTHKFIHLSIHSLHSFMPACIHPFRMHSVRMTACWTSLSSSEPTNQMLCCCTPTRMDRWNPISLENSFSIRNISTFSTSLQHPCNILATFLQHFCNIRTPSLQHLCNIFATFLQHPCNILTTLITFATFFNLCNNFPTFSTLP